MIAPYKVKMLPCYPYAPVFTEHICRKCFSNKLRLKFETGERNAMKLVRKCLLKKQKQTHRQTDTHTHTHAMHTNTCVHTHTHTHAHTHAHTHTNKQQEQQQQQQ